MKGRIWKRGDLVYLPQGCILFNGSDLGYCRTYRPEMGLVLDKIDNRPFPDRYRIFCMGNTYVTHADQVHGIGDP